MIAEVDNSDLLFNWGDETLSSEQKRFEEEIVRPFLRSTPSRLAVGDGKVSVEHPAEYLVRAEM